MALNATQTASAYNKVMRAHHIGPNYLIGTVNVISKTLSDIILLGRIPNKATIVGAIFQGVTAGTNAVYKVGVKGGDGGNGAGADTTILATTDIVTAAGIASAAFVRHRVSLSDTDAHLGADVYMTLISGTWTVSASLDYQISYVMDGNGE
jgi:hypothetical protein